MKILITTDDPENRNAGMEFIRILRHSAAESGSGAHAWVESAEDADAILLIKRGERFGRDLLGHPLIRKYRNKCYVYDVDDVPIGYLPGIYASMPRGRFLASQFKAYSYLSTANAFVDALSVDPTPCNQDLLLSFMGSATSSVRKKLFRTRIWQGRPDVVVENTSGWNNWDDGPERTEGRRRYAQIMSRSRFVLCPRGGGTATYRLFESMQLSRVPVILADDWVAPEGPAWDAFSIRVPERDFARVPEILAGFELRYEEMGKVARREWEAWFSPRVLFDRLAEAVEALQATSRRGVLDRCGWTVQGGYWRTRNAARQCARSAALRVLSLMGREVLVADRPQKR